MIYIVKSGDTLTKLASRFSTTVSALATANNIRNINLIFIGQRLTIPDGRQSTQSFPKQNPLINTGGASGSWGEPKAPPVYNYNSGGQITVPTAAQKASYDESFRVPMPESYSQNQPNDVMPIILIGGAVLLLVLLTSDDKTSTRAKSRGTVK